MDYQSFNGVRPSIRIRILVVDDQYMCLNVVTKALRSLKYEVLTAKHPFEALYTLRLMQGGIDLVISDYHMPDMNGVQLQKRIHEEFKIPVIMMSIDSREFVVVESLRGGSKVFLVKPINVEKVENVWQYVVANNKGKSPSSSSVGVDRIRVGNYLAFQDQIPSANYMQEEDQEGAGNNKNHKVIWTNALHTLFLQAINKIGLDKAVPKKILDRMNVPGLTRQHVASHLQKYRKFLKKVAESGLVNSNDPQKALNEAFEMIMTNNAEYHDMILSLPPSQFGRSHSQPANVDLGSSSSSSSVVRSNAPLLDNSSPSWNNGNPNYTCSYNILPRNGLGNNNEQHQFPARLGLNSNQYAISNKHLIPSRLGLSNPEDDQYGFHDTTSTRVNDLDHSTYKGAVVFGQNNNWMNQQIDQPNTSGYAYGDPSNFNINSTLTLTNNLHENNNSTSNHCPYVQDQLMKTTVLPPPPPPLPADMSEKSTLGDDIFDSLPNLLLLPQGNEDIDMALEYAPHLLDEEPITTNYEPGDQKWDDDFIGSFLVDDPGPYMEADKRSC